MIKNTKAEESAILRLLDNEGNCCFVKADDLILIRPTTSGPEFHTKDAMYYYPATMNQLLKWYEGHGFDRLNRTSLVKLSRVKAFDPEKRKVHFEFPWNENSLFATVSAVNISKVQHLIHNSPLPEVDEF